MARSSPPSVARTAPARSLAEYDAGVYADYLRDLTQELREPPDFVLRAEPVQVPGPRRGRVIHDGVALWLD